MKKVMVGLLILIPILILLIVALVSNIVSLNAHIAVEDLTLTYKGTENTAYTLALPYEKEKKFCLNDYIDIKISPEKATNKTVEWQIAGDVIYTSESHKTKYESYARDYAALKEELSQQFGAFSGERLSLYEEIVRDFYYTEKEDIISAMADRLLPAERSAAAFVDSKGNEVVSNTTGDIIFGSYCNFNVRLVAENVSKTISISVVGYDVEQVALSFPESEDNTLYVGESMRVLASYTPIDSIVNYTKWSSSDSSVLSVDDNGVVTAHRAGTATITLGASVFSAENQNKYVYGTSQAITVVSAGASPIYGNNITTSKQKLLLDEIGLVYGQITSVKGGELKNDSILIKEDTVYVTLAGGEQLTIASCSDGDIAIRNQAFYEEKNGYVLSVGENTLKLSVVWADMLKEGEPTGIDWSSSDEQIATVDANGVVTGLSDGFVTITASRSSSARSGRASDAICSISLNVRKKLSSIQLRTSDASLAIGLARETVFASQKYVNVGVSRDKQANHFDIVVQGEPENATIDALKTFYYAYNFDIIEGGDYAHFDEEMPNRVVFDSDKLEGKGKQSVKIRVSAKYPKNEGFTKFTIEELSLNVVYGVAVSNIDELYAGVADQQDYFKSHLVVREDKDRIYWQHEAENAVYVVYKNHYSTSKYAVVLEDNCMYEYRVDEKGEPIAYLGWWEPVQIYGDVYGNNHKLYAMQGNVSKEGYLMRVCCGGLTISNLIMRANEISSEELGNNDTIDFKGLVVELKANDAQGNGQDQWGRYFAEDGNGVTFEYSIIENAIKGMNLRNTDVEFNGCIIRNMTQCGIYVPVTMNDQFVGEENINGKPVVHPNYPHITFHNVICSNTLGSMMSLAYNCFTMISNTQFRFVDGEKYSGNDEQLIAQSKLLEKANEAYFLEHFYGDGINAVVKQTGFLRAYNWMNVDNAGLIQTGYSNVDNVLSQYFGQIIKGDDNLMTNYVYKDSAGNNYLHFAFLVSGIYLKGGIYDGPTYLELNMLDDSYDSFDIRDVDMKNTDLGAMGNLVVNTLLSKASLKIYGYNNQAAIKPGDTYELNARLIAELHS